MCPNYLDLWLQIAGARAPKCVNHLLTDLLSYLQSVVYSCTFYFCFFFTELTQLFSAMIYLALTEHSQHSPSPNFHPLFSPPLRWVSSSAFCFFFFFCHPEFLKDFPFFFLLYDFFFFFTFNDFQQYPISSGL